MTIREISSQLFSLSVGGFFNREKFTKPRLENQLSSFTRKIAGFGVGSKYYMEIALPDGWWYFIVTKYADRADGFDYYIPETREQESAIKNGLFGRVNK